MAIFASSLFPPGNLCSIFQSENKLETRPDIIYRANFRIDQSFGEANSLNIIKRKIGRHAGTLLWPRDPEHSVWLEFYGVLRQSISEVTFTLDKEHGKVEWLARSRVYSDCRRQIEPFRKPNRGFDEGNSEAGPNPQLSYE